MKNYLLAAAVLCLAAPAHAGGPVVVADDPMVQPAAGAPAPASYDWTGFYVGLSAVTGTLNDSVADFDASGFGVQAGYLRDLGTFVIGGELAYAKGDYGNDAPDSDWDTTRLKLIGGYDAGRFLPYVFVGLTDYSINQTAPVSDTMTNFGVGARLALGGSGKIVLGVEYLTESKDNFGDSGFNVENKELSLRIDYRF